MNKIDYCPNCGSYLNYDGDVKEWYCSNIIPNGGPSSFGDCDYSEFDSWDSLGKFRKELD